MSMSAGIYPVVHFIADPVKGFSSCSNLLIVTNPIEGFCSNSSLQYIVTDSVEGSCSYSELLQEPAN